MLPKFFQNIIGQQGLAIMDNLAKASTDLEGYLSPRIVVSWLRQSSYGVIAQIKDCPITSLTKSGYGYTGTALIKGIDYQFSNTTEEHVAAVVALATDGNIRTVEVKDLDLARLAKTIDLLVKAQKKGAAAGYEHTSPAQNLQPEPPLQPVAIQPVQNQKAKPLKIPKVGKKVKPGVVKSDWPMSVEKDKIQKPLKVTKSEALNTCNVCGQKMFKGGVFTGCLCFSSLAKSVKVNVGKELTLTFGEDWDDDAVLTLIGVLKDGR